jgi:hypothetical protein
MTWERFEKPARTGARLPINRVKIMTNGRLYLPAAFMEKHNPSHVELLFDPSTGRMAIKPIPSKTETSYKVYRTNTRFQPSGSVSLIKFLRYYDLGNGVVGHHFNITEDDGLFVIDLNDPQSRSTKS